VNISSCRSNTRYTCQNTENKWTQLVFCCDDKQHTPVGPFYVFRT